MGVSASTTRKSDTSENSIKNSPQLGFFYNGTHRTRNPRTRVIFDSAIESVLAAKITKPSFELNKNNRSSVILIT
jgi:hypothetical protein